MASTETSSPKYSGNTEGLSFFQYMEGGSCQLVCHRLGSDDAVALRLFAAGSGAGLLFSSALSHEGQKTGPAP